MSKKSIAPYALLIAIGGLASIELYTWSKAKHRMEPIYIFDQFSLANHAVERCGNPEPGQRKRFLRNLEVTTARTAKDLRQRHAEKTNEQVAEMLKARDRQREQEIEALVEAGDCADPEIEKYLKRFEIRAKLRVG